MMSLAWRKKPQSPYEVAKIYIGKRSSRLCPAVVDWSAPKSHRIVLILFVATFERKAGAVEALSQRVP